jgi:recombinational DNA repair protein (RecF pathway)
VFFQEASRHKVQQDGRGGMLARLVSFQLNLLREIGLYPVLEYCVNCRSPFNARWPEVYFSNTARGLICKDCQGAFPDKTRLTLEGAKCLSDAKLLVSAQERTVGQVEEILIGYITDTVGRPTKMAKYILNP